MFSRQPSLLLREGAVVVPQHKLEPFLGWLHKINGYPGAENPLHFFQVRFTPASQLLLTNQNLPPCIPCTLTKQNTAADRTVQGGLFESRMVDRIGYVDFVVVGRFDDHFGNHMWSHPPFLCFPLHQKHNRRRGLFDTVQRLDRSVRFAS